VGLGNGLKGLTMAENGLVEIRYLCSQTRIALKSAIQRNAPTEKLKSPQMLYTHCPSGQIPENSVHIGNF
jgi:hypothetical protein